MNIVCTCHSSTQTETVLATLKTNIFNRTCLGTSGSACSAGSDPAGSDPAVPSQPACVGLGKALGRGIGFGFAGCASCGWFVGSTCWALGPACSWTLGPACSSALVPACSWGLGPACSWGLGQAFSVCCCCCCGAVTVTGTGAGGRILGSLRGSGGGWE